MLALAGGVLGAVIAYRDETAGDSIAGGLPRASDIRVDAPVFLFTFAAAIFTGLLLASSRRSTHHGPICADRSMKSGRSTTSSRTTLRLRSALVISEITLACSLINRCGPDAAQLRQPVADRSGIPAETEC